MLFIKHYLNSLFLQIWQFYLVLFIFIKPKNILPINNLRIFYGGSKGGNIGGPKVKIQKLNNKFPEKFFNFNILYLISNSQYLTKSTLTLIKEKNIPIFLNQNGVYYPAWFEGNYSKKNLEMSYAYHLADYVLWQSNFCKKASDKFLGKRTGHGEILYNSVDTKVFKPVRKSSKNFTFLITGNINKKNNYRIISVIKALKKINTFNKSVRLIVAGNIESKNFLKKFIFEMKLEKVVNLISKFDQIEAPKIYQLADAYITMAYKDNCPTAVLEAMSTGLPVLYSASGGLPELVNRESGIGLYVENSWEEIKIPNTEDILKGMIEIIECKNFMSEASRIRVLEKFDLRIWYERHEYLFNNLSKENI